MRKKISIIIRTKDEERWIAQSLAAVFSQEEKDFEVILVDNQSSDKTIEKARQFGIKKVITCTEYMPGKALNAGIRESEGEFIVALSGHCIPVTDKWLGTLVRNFDSPDIAGVYGRQEAMSFSSDADKRDLALVFGLDRKVQIKDSFFHNANSVIRRKVWDEIPYDEGVTNIEDRVWAHKVLQKGYRIVYEPDASVYHYHGIHQDGNTERCVNVVKILENLHSDYGYKSIDLEKLNIIALVPVKGPIQYLNKRPLLAYTVDHLKESRYIKKVILSTDNADLAKLGKEMGVEVPFLRDASLSREHVDVGKVLQYSLERIEEKKIFPDIIVSLEITFPFRPKGILDDMIVQLSRGGYDSVVAVRMENKAIWKATGNSIVQLDEGMLPRQFKEPTFIGLKGIGCVTHPEFLREGNLLGEKIGIYEVNNPYSHLEVRSEEEFKLASALIDTWERR